MICITQLSRTHAGPRRTGKEEQESISRYHILAIMVCSLEEEKHSKMAIFDTSVPSHSSIQLKLTLELNLSSPLHGVGPHVTTSISGVG